MHILVDATCATNRITGFERYTREVCRALTTLCAEKQTKVSILLAHGASWLGDTPRNVTVKHSPFNKRLLTEQVWIPKEIYSLQPDVCFFPGFPPSPTLRYSRTRIMKTVYDGVLWNRPETLSLRAKLYLKPLETLGMSFYDVIHTISDSSAREIAQIFPLAASRIVNSGIGTDVARYQHAVPCTQQDRVRAKYDLPDRFFLSVGTLEPRKNLTFLLRVIAKLRQKQPEIKLVIAGRHGWGTETFMETLRALELAEVVYLLGAVDDEDLPALYQMADVFVFPSLHEGFGLPIVEAMAAGAPVIASNTTSIPEAAGDAAILLSPTDEKAWIQALDEVLNSEELRHRLRAAGRIQASKFTWEKVAERILDSALEISRADTANVVT